MIDDADVAIVGGGPAGSTAAYCLARSGVSALIVERAAEPYDKPGESLAPAATPLLQRLGLFEAFLATMPLPCYGNRSCWGENGTPAAYDFIRDPYGHGWHIDRCAFERMLLDAAQAAGATVRRGVSLTAVQREAGCWKLGLSTAEQVRTRFVIDASGRAAVFARRIGARRVQYDRLIAITALLVARGQPCQDSTTLVEAVPEGWWYSAALPEARLALALMTDPDLLTGPSLRQWDRLQARLADAPLTRSRVAGGCYEPAAALRVAAAGTSTLSSICDDGCCDDGCCGDGWLACGDAAAAYDPLSSHGIVAAVGGGAHAASAAAAWRSGGPEALGAYAGRVQSGFARYLALRRAYYGEETRWPEAPFWSRRRAVSAPTVEAGSARVHG